MKTIEMKKTQELSSVAQSKEETFTVGKITDFVGGVKDEFHRISWTDSEELKTYTKIVVGATFFLGMGIYVVDVFIQGFLTGLENLIRLIAI